MCASKGFDAVHPDNVVGYENATGFPLSAADQIVYNAWFAALAHERHLAIAFADSDQIPQLDPTDDYGLAESCSAQGCGAFSPFHADGKAVFIIEYTNATSSATHTGTYCPQDEALGFDVMLKKPQRRRVD